MARGARHLRRRWLVKRGKATTPALIEDLIPSRVSLGLAAPAGCLPAFITTNCQEMWGTEGEGAVRITTLNNTKSKAITNLN